MRAREQRKKRQGVGSEATKRDELSRRLVLNAGIDAYKSATAD